jgi:hypothetical protein
VRLAVRLALGINQPPFTNIESFLKYSLILLDTINHSLLYSANKPKMKSAIPRGSVRVDCDVAVIAVSS